MSGIQAGRNYTAAQITNFNRKDTGDLHQAASTAQGFLIKGKHFKYTVTKNGTGDIHVAVKKPWYMTKGQAQRAATKATGLEVAIKNRGDHFTLVDTEATRKGNKVGTQLNPMLVKLANKGKDPEVAVYGKALRADVQDQLKSQGIKPVTIDKYNEMCGIGWNEAHPVMVDDLLTKLRNGDVSKNLAPQTQVSDGRRLEWAQYLEKNVDRLDVMAKCRTLAQKTDGGDKLAQFLVKNCPPEKMETGLQAKMNSAVDRQGRLDLIKDTPLYKEMIKAGNDPTYVIPPGTKGLDSVFQNAFFRTTSKMGVEFFSAQKMPIAFWTAKLGAESELAPMNPTDMQMKPWKNLENRDAGGQHRAESITYSEMRYVDRLKTNLRGVQGKAGHEEMAQFKLKNVQIFPVQLKDVEGRVFIERHKVNSPV